MKNLISYIIIIMIILSSCKYEKPLIGTIEDDGNYYKAYNDIFILKNLNREQYPDFFFNDIYVSDNIDEEGYRLSYSFVSDIIDEIFFYRNHTEPEEFEKKLYEEFDDQNLSQNTPYKNISEVDLNGCHQCAARNWDDLSRIAVSQSR